MRWVQRYLSSSTSLSGFSEMHHDTCKWVFKISEDLEKKVPVKKEQFSPFFTPKTLYTFLAIVESLCRDTECFPKKVKNSCEDVSHENWNLHQSTRKIFFDHHVETKVGQIIRNSHIHRFMILRSDGFSLKCLLHQYFYKIAILGQQLVNTCWPNVSKISFGS